VVGDDVRGVAVHEAARIAAAASPGEILVSATTRALATDGMFSFEESPGHDLKGLDGTRVLHAVI